MSDGFLELFKYSVPNQKKAFNKVKGDPRFGDMTYRKFRKENIELDILSNYIACIKTKEKLLDVVQIRNLFRYLSKNLHGSNLHSVKKVMFKIYDLENQIINEITLLEKEKGNEAIIQNLNMLLNELGILKKIIIDTTKGKTKGLEKELEFTALANQLLNPDSYEDTILQTLYYNSKTLNNSEENSKTFSEMFYKEILKTNVGKDEQRKRYYILLGNYLMETNLLSLDKKVINALGLRKSSKNFTSSLEQKIHKMERDEDTGRYIVDDYVVTFDNSTTSRYDDALSVERTPNGSYILGIHIADVHALKLDAFSRIDEQEALKYKSQASLKEYREKDAISLFVEISKNGLIIDKSFLMTKVEVNKNLYYDDFPRLIQRSGNTPLNNTAINLAGLYQVVGNDRMPLFPTPREMAHSIVHKYMLLYGCIASKYAEDKKIPILYLGDNKHVSINKTPYDVGFDNFDTYSRLTSPIWDLESEVNQLSLCECLFNRLSQREKHNMKMNLLMAGNHINNKD